MFINIDEVDKGGYDDTNNNCFNNIIDNKSVNNNYSSSDND